MWRPSDSTLSAPEPFVGFNVLYIGKADGPRQRLAPKRNIQAMWDLRNSGVRAGSRRLERLGLIQLQPGECFPRHLSFEEAP
jgi:hypothetical protein